jgi:hypothetical protein
MQISVLIQNLFVFNHVVYLLQHLEKDFQIGFGNGNFDEVIEVPYRQFGNFPLLFAFFGKENTHHAFVFLVAFAVNEFSFLERFEHARERAGFHTQQGRNLGGGRTFFLVDVQQHETDGRGDAVCLRLCIVHPGNQVPRILYVEVHGLFTLHFFG